jgi:hypothetical protein
VLLQVLLTTFEATSTFAAVAQQLAPMLAAAQRTIATLRTYMLDIYATCLITLVLSAGSFLRVKLKAVYCIFFAATEFNFQTHFGALFLTPKFCLF